MARRCPEAAVVGRATLPRYRFLINERAYATLVADASATVHGLLWQLSAKDERALDDYEGVPEGHYIKVTKRVRLLRGPLRRAMIYLAINDQPGVPRSRYIQGILAAAQALRFPKAYMRGLAEWGGSMTP
jgi:gamma-glutamylcyclotransferase (GGCT)/AIG2-like uncharacterized protein YtfP